MLVHIPAVCVDLGEKGAELDLGFVVPLVIEIGEGRVLQIAAGGDLFSERV